MTLQERIAHLAAAYARLAENVARLAGWRRLGAGAGAGIAAALAMPPVYAAPFLVAGLAVGVWLLDGARERPLKSAFAIGWAFGFGYFLAGTYWIAFPLMVDPVHHAWMIPFALTLFPGGLALFPGLAFMLARALWSAGWPRLLVFAGALAALDYARGHVLTGLPWNLYGMAFAGSDWTIQPAAWIGVYGLTLLAALAGALFASWRVCERQSLLGPALGLAIVAGVALAGALRLPDEATPAVADVRLRIVQPNTPQEDKYRPGLVLQNWRTLLDLTAKPGLDKVTHVIWPEAAPPFLLSEEAVALGEIAEVLPPGVPLLTGAVRIDRTRAFDDRPFFNSFYVVDSEGRIESTYDKAHLVPFGEYMPFAGFLDAWGITKIVQLPGGLREGPGPRTLSVSGAPPFGPLICYEIIFPGSAIDAAARPRWLVNVTDDSWFADTSGPRQHLAIARVRAVEEGLPVVRAANTGISTIIDPYGRTQEKIAYGSAGILDADLPESLPPTLYGQWSDYISIAMWLLVFLAGVVFRKEDREIQPQVE